MTDAAYIFAGYGLTTAVLAGYTTWVITRRRSLARTLKLDGGSQPPAST